MLTQYYLVQVARSTTAAHIGYSPSLACTATRLSMDPLHLAVAFLTTLTQRQPVAVVNGFYDVQTRPSSSDYGAAERPLPPPWNLLLSWHVEKGPENALMLVRRCKSGALLPLVRT